MSDSLRPHESQHTRPPCPSPTPRVYPNSCPSSWWCHPAISSTVVPFSSCPQSFPASGSFPKSQLISSSRSLLNISSVFLIHAPILFLRFWIIFTISTLNSFSGRLPISSSLIWSLVITLLLHLYNISGCLSLFFDGGVACISVLLIIWPKATSTGVCRQLGGTRSWYQDEDLWGISCWLIFSGVWSSLLVQWFEFGAPATGSQAQLWPESQDPGYSGILPISLSVRSPPPAPFRCLSCDEM